MLWLLLAVSIESATAAVETPAHQMHWRQWSVADGLPQVTVNEVVQGPNGYLWLATQDGVARFDGVRFENFTLADHPGLGHAVVQALAFDAEETLWIGTMTGLALLRAGRLESVSPADASTLGMVLTLAPRRQGGVWIGTRTGLWWAQGSRVEALATALDSEPVVAVVDLPGQLPVAVGRRRLLIDPEGEARLLELDGRVPAVLTAVGAARGLWLGTTDGLFLVALDGRVLAREARGREVERIAADGDGGLWLATDQGLWRRPPSGEAESLDLDLLPASTWVRAVFVDREHSLWVGTQLSGLHRGHATRFRRLGARDGLPAGAVWAVSAGSGGQLWAGTPDGVYRGGLGGFEKLPVGDQLPHPMVVAALEDRLGGQWFGTRKGLAYRPADGPRLQTVKELGASMVSTLLMDDDGSVLAGGVEGLFRIRGNAVTRIDLSALGEVGAISALARDARGRIWLGHEAGVGLREDGRWRAAGGRGAGELSVFSLSPFGEGVLAAGFGSLSYVDAERIQALGTDQGFGSQTITYSQVEADRLWFWSVLGIGSVSLEALQALLEGRSERVQPRFFGSGSDSTLGQCNGGHQAAGVISEGRWLWCPSLDGLLVLDLERTQPAARGPVALLESLQTGHRAYPTTAPLELGAEERDLSLQFTSLSLSAPEQLRFEARLVGYDRVWQTLADRRTAYYTNLPPGRYRFEARAIDADGVRGEAVGVDFSIDARWHETLAARFGAFGALAVLAWLLVHTRIRLLKRQRTRLEARVQARTRELAQANERLRAASLTDPLTGLHNRRFLSEQLQLELARCRRQRARGEGGELVLLLIDLDHFKSINDRYGHAVGDAVLCETAERLRALARASDFVLRWGGEEFLLIARDCGWIGAAALAQRVREALSRRPFEVSTRALAVTGSIGFARWPGQTASGDDWTLALALADAGTYIAKREGRNRAVGVDLLRSPPAQGFGSELIEEPMRLEKEGWIALLRGPDTAAAAQS